MVRWEVLKKMDNAEKLPINMDSHGFCFIIEGNYINESNNYSRHLVLLCMDIIIK